VTGSSFDIAVIGGGIAGAGVAAYLSQERRVVILERESQPGYHATGRSAALFSEIYGSAAIRALSRASRPFFEKPPAGFSDYPLLSPRGALHIARSDQKEALDKFAALPDVTPATVAMDGEAACRISPLLKPDYVAQALLETDACDMDVHAIHTGFLRMLRANAGQVAADSEVLALDSRGPGWRVTTASQTFEARVVVNASGAWADRIAALAGLATKGLEPRRRTAIIVNAPEGKAIEASPLTVDIDEAFYFKPESGRLLISPCDETPSAPCDAQPEDIDVAIAIERIERATELRVDRVQRKWAGLRTFAPDRNPVMGYDENAPGFFWLAGQGGYGIQTSEAMSRLAASLVLERGVPDDILACGLDVTALSPAR
jgi:D-arginine dehydrogenase